MTDTSAFASVGVQLDTLAHGNRRAVGGVDVHATVLASLTGNKASAALEHQLAGRTDGEARGGSGTRVTLELGSRRWRLVSIDLNCSWSF